MKVRSRRANPSPRSSPFAKGRGGMNLRSRTKPIPIGSRRPICVAMINHGTLRVAFDLKEIIAARLGENYQLHGGHLNRTLVAAQRVIGFDKVYARAEGAYLYDMDNQAYLDFLSGYSVFNIGRNHPVVKQTIRDVLDLDLPNMVQMDCSLLSGLLAEAIVKRTPPHLDAVFFCNSGTEAMEGP